MSDEIICVIYARTACDDIQYPSIEEQLQICRAHAAKRGFEIVGEYTDAGVSGISTNKPALNRLENDVRHRKISKVIVKDITRLHRGEPLDYADQLAKKFQKFGAEIVFINSFPSQNDSEASAIIRNVKRAIMNQMEVIMPDITMCDNTSCDMREQCYRFMATPDARQSVTTFTPISKTECEYFMPLKRGKLWQEGEATDS
jgi:DNA invertase Pin-like site-specific DNA recombinase